MHLLHIEAWIGDGWQRVVRLGDYEPPKDGSWDDDLTNAPETFLGATPGTFWIDTADSAHAAGRPPPAACSRPCMSPPIARARQPPLPDILGSLLTQQPCQVRPLGAGEEVDRGRGQGESGQDSPSPWSTTSRR